MSMALLTDAAERLGPVVEEVAFLGGASVALWLSDPASAPARVTIDVDVVVVVAGTVQYYALGERLRHQGFSEDATSNVICRWRHRDGAILDVMPTDPAVLGFSNRWYPDAFATAIPVDLPSGLRIRAVSPPYLVATKIEAFLGRGNRDYLASRDFEDLVRMLDGRPELGDEIAAAPSDVREFIAASFLAMRDDTFFETGVAGALSSDQASQARLPLVLGRIEQVSAPPD
jgi:hypothetical protein